jgi:hypothetical protein
MKYVKTLGVAAIAVLGLMSFGAGTASATKLCTNSACTTVYPAATTLHFSLKSGTTARWTSGGSTIATCTGSTIVGTTSNESGGFVETFGDEITWSGCSQTTKSTFFPEGRLDIEYVIGTNGKIRATGEPVTLGIFGVSCLYEGFEGTLTGGETPILSIASTMNKVEGSFLCPGFAGFDAEYVLTQPHALYVGS